MSKYNGLCEQVDMVLEHADSFAELTPADKTLAKTHWQSCPRCRFVHEVCLQESGNNSPLKTDGPLPSLDDLSRQRAIEQIVAKSRTTIDPRRRFRPVAIATVAAALVIIGMVSLFIVERESSHPTVAAPSNMVNAVPPAGSVVMLSGANTNISELNTAFATGDVASVRQGNVAIQLPTNVLLLLGSQSELVGREITDTALDVQLHRGSLFINATPGRKGPPFRIFTPHGTVTVTGTALAVHVTNDTSTVDVYRGKVEVTHATNTAPVKVRANQSTTVDSQGIAAVISQDFSTRGTMVARLQYLTDLSTNVASLRVNSTPDNAQVFLDDVYLGKTPLEVVVAAGHNRMRVERELYVPIREVVDLNAGNTLERNFLLTIADGNTVQNNAGGGDVDATGIISAKAAPRKPVQTAKVLLQEARDAMERRDWSSAIGHYTEITRRFPRSIHCANAQISAGRILLEHLSDPAGALRHFNSYIQQSGNGSLLPEALLGRARAQRALGRIDAERNTLEQLVERFPSSIHRKIADKRLQQLQKK